MIKTFTQNDVIRFVYDEVSPEERFQMEGLLLIDAEFVKLYNRYSATKALIKKSRLDPSENVIDRILNYSKTLTLQQ